MNIVVTGSLAYDFIMDFPESFEENILPDKLKTLSVSFLAQNFSKNFGGVAGNIAYNLGLLTVSSTILSSAGANDFDIYENHLKKVGVNVSHINIVKNEFTANMFMITDKNNCQIAGFYPGAMSYDDKLSVEDIKQKIDFIIISPTVPDAIVRFVRIAKDKKIPYLYDPAQQIPRISVDDLKEGIDGAEILIGNDYELAMIMKKTGYSREEILKRVKILITTLGDKGSKIESKNDTLNINIAQPKKVIDPTGAGDAYIAGFIAGYLKKKDLKTCGQMGATLASFAIEKYGTQNHSVNLSEFRKHYENSFKSSLMSE